MILKNKRGSLEDLIFIMTIVFGAALMILISFKLHTDFDAEIQARDDIDSRGKAASTKLLSYFPGVIDNSFLFLFIGLNLVSFVFAALVRISPVFLVLYIIALSFVIFTAGALSNAYEAISDDPNMIGVSSQLTSINFVLDFLPLLTGVMGSILAIVMFKGWRDSRLG